MSTLQRGFRFLRATSYIARAASLQETAMASRIHLARKRVRAWNSQTNLHPPTAPYPMRRTNVLRPLAVTAYNNGKRFFQMRQVSVISPRFPSSTSWLRTLHRKRLRLRNHSRKLASPTSAMLPSRKNDETQQPFFHHKTWLHELRTSPANWMTASRIVISPALGYFVIHGHHTAAIVGCGLAALSDGLDGYVARRFDCQTQFGTYLDPLADKVVINVLSLSLWVNGTLPTSVVGVWFCKDVIMLAGGAAFYFQSQRPSLEPTFISKCNTALQFLTLSVALVDSTTAAPIAHALLQGILPLTCATTVISLGSYYSDALVLINGSSLGKKNTRR